MSKKLITFTLAAVMTLQPFAANATDLNAAFGNLLSPGGTVSVNEPGRYQSGARNSFIAGGLEMRVPKSSNAGQMFSVTPPRITAGCNGISAHFGGFSFISGAEFEQMLKSIASGAALGFVSMMVMKTLCPPCEAVVQFLKTAAQQAARLSKDSCKWGQDMAAKWMAGESSQSNTMQVCGTSLASSGSGSDYLKLMESIDGACNSMTKAVDALVGENPAAASNPASAAKLQCDIGVGNVTWQRLRAFDVSGAGGAGGGTVAETGYRRKLLLLNMLGTELNQGGSAGTATASSCEVDDAGTKLSPSEENKTVFCPPKLRPADVVGLFLCGNPDAAGAPTGSQSERVNEYCSTFYTAASTVAAGSFGRLTANKVYQCSDDKALCNTLTLTDTSAIAQGEGFLVQINKTLLKGVELVRTNQEMTPDVLRLMQVAPYPLYQAINAAAVYPSAAADLIDAMSILVAEQTTVAFLDDALRLEGRTTGGKATCLTQAQATTILDAVGSMRSANRARLQQIAQNISTQEMLSEQIRSVNLAIQRQVMSQDMLASGQFGQAVGKALSQNVSKGTTPGAPAPATP